jgi:hypothetical protein
VSEIFFSFFFRVAFLSRTKMPTLAKLVKEAYKEGKGQTMVPDNIYDKMMAKIMALPVKKRHKWHDTLTDKWGTKTKCIYKEGQIYNWCILKGAYCWVKVVPFRGLHNEGGIDVPCSSVGDAMGEDNFEAMFWSTVEENQTGNHYRNHRVKVPKQVYGTAHS